MSDIMRPIPFSDLMDWVLTEYDKHSTIFGVKEIYRHESGKMLPMYDEKIELPYGPAAGPHTQLAQNLIASYAGGSRFFELKTVQILDGEDLPVSKPCILAEDEGYNVEWSTELYVPQALDEYIKGWYAIKLLSRQLDLGSDEGFIFNMSVGYDLEGIKSEKIDRFIEGLKDASQTDAWKECESWAMANLSRLPKLDEAFIQSISPRVCRSITLSTLHGCPPDEIERIATYLLEEKKLNTYVKCNPTLLGYEFTRETLDSMGYKYMVFDDHHFKADLQFDEAVPMIKALQDKAEKVNLEFGVKLTNTFPVKIAADELPGEEMYMSGKSLYPLTIALAHKLEEAFQGKLKASFSGGADQLNTAEIVEAGIWPVTIATTLLKPGGYNRLKPISDILSDMDFDKLGDVNIPKLKELAETSQDLKHHVKAKKSSKAGKIEKIPSKAPFTNCFAAPCETGCPFNQDIPAYIKLVGEKKYAEALECIMERNPLPFITGTICYQRCAASCTRYYYDESVKIRELKLEAAEKGYDAVLKKLIPVSERCEKVAIIGGGPAGMAAAHILAKAGCKVTIFEKREKLGGIVRYAIPESQISNKTIDKDISFLQKLGVEIITNSPVIHPPALLADGYTHVIIASGHWEPGKMKTEDFISAEELNKDNDFYIIGDAVRGNGSVAEAIADAHKVCSSILSEGLKVAEYASSKEKDSGNLKYSASIDEEPARCLDCKSICENCVDVCPNRANLSINVPGFKTAQVVHIDKMCNECGNCLVFCPYDSAPYKDKFTVFGSEDDFKNSENSGFLPLPGGGIKLRLDGKVVDKAPEELQKLIDTIQKDYSYIL